MIVTVFGDVHGNLVALEKLFQIEKDDTDLFISHGDIVNYGPWSNECVAFLNKIPNIKLLKGNHEEFFIAGEYEGKNEVAQAFFQFCYPKFDAELINNISNFDDHISVGDYTIRHTLGNQYIFADTNIENLEIETNYMFGHSHQQFKRDKNSYFLYNTGSIGQNRSLLNLSCYLKYDTDKNTVEMKSFVHDIGKVIQEMESQNYPQICLDYYKSKKLF
ncbi:metallophosphoesterase family protein [Kaistella polysaccharea]|uniref:metallophosphoesterase family protein n=1 Tax=Kaistella polysaccharea TaxID=2878534 RepID=UPI001CF3C8B2|nr:metallophosphoesterase [Kaistella polysaccharea]